MWPVFPAHLTLAAIAGVFALLFLALRGIQPTWWKRRAVRGVFLSALGGSLAGMALWGAGRLAGSLLLVHAGAGIAYFAVIVLVPAAALAPLAALIDRVLAPRKVRDALPAPTTKEDRIGRRALLRMGTASLPAIAAVGSASGFAQARTTPAMPLVRLRFPDLHPDLEGLRILQISDVHLGACFATQDLADALDALGPDRQPDLIVLTGDLADDPSQIPEALRIVAATRTRLGALASLGNHEYLHGIDVTRPLYEESAVPLLVGSGRTFQVGRARLFVGGADDPVHMGGDIAWMLEPSIQAAAAEAPADADFRLLLCHRPEGFGPAKKAGFHLTLSGHTHGGQLGILGRSLLEYLRPGVGWWGRYGSGASQLYTTSGFGHWFPFRFGCPTEMPIVVLERDGLAAPRQRQAIMKPATNATPQSGRRSLRRLSRSIVG